MISEKQMALFQCLDKLSNPQILLQALQECLGELERKPTWAEWMETIDELYPSEIFGEGSDDNTGPRIVALCREIDRLQAIVTKLQDIPALMEQGGADTADRAARAINKLQTPGWYWDDRCLEESHDTIEEMVDGYDIGEVIELRPMHELPKIYVLREKNGHSIHDTEEAAEAAREEASDDK